MVAFHLLVAHELLPRFAKIERIKAEESLTQVRRGLDQRIDTLRVKVSDWSRWDDARDFLLGKMPDFQARNVQPNTPSEMQLSMIVYADLSGRIHLQAGCDPDTSTPMPVPQSLAEHLQAHSGLMGDGKLVARHGLLNLPEGLLMFAMKPVTSTDNTGEAVGVCLFGRFLADSEIKQIQLSTGLTGEIIPVSDLTASQQVIFAQTLVSPNDTAMNVTSDEQIELASVARDIYGKPAALVRLALPRPVYQEGVATIAILSWQSICTAAMLGAISFFLFETLVLSRISRFSAQLRTIAQTQDLHCRVTLSGSDEVARLSEPVNYLLESLHETQGQLTRQRLALETSEHRLSLALEAAGDGLWDIDLTGNTIYFSSTWARMMQYAEQDLPKTCASYQKIIHPDDANHLSILTARHVRGETPDIFAEIRLLTGAGTWKWVLARGRVVKRSESGEALRMIGTHQDIDARRLADNELRESRELFRNAFVESACGMAMVSPDGHFLRVNKVLCDLLGYSENELLDLNFQSVTHPDDLDADIAFAQDLLCRRREQYSMEKRYVRKDGVIVWALLTVGLVCDNDGGVRYLVSQVQNISQRKQNEIELNERSLQLSVKTIEAEAAKHKAEDASRTKSEFLANMSHEIRTPMTAILGYADLLLEESINKTQLQSHVNTIQRNGKHLLSLINDILDLSKIEAGKMAVEKIDCDPVQIVAEVESLMRVRATEKQLRFIVQHESALPRRIQTDPTRLRQILLNMVSNAIKFTPSGEVAIRVKVIADATGLSNKIRFVVADTGIGMDETQITRLFTAFSQADTSTTRKYGGTGLGLAISKRLAEMLGGTISASSTVGEGSQFCLMVDAGEVSDLITQSPAPVANPLDVPVSPNQLARRHILLAEDGVDNQRLISFYLTRAGATVELAENGQVAMDRVAEAALRGQVIDVILMDMQMPLVDGYAAATRLREQGCAIPIIALTAHAMDGDRKKCLDAGCLDYLTKPIDRNVLIHTIVQHCRKAKLNTTTLRSTLIANESLQELVNTYVDELPEQAQQLLMLLQDNNLSDLRRLLHQIKGAGGGYGFSPISEAAASAEQSIKVGNDIQTIQHQVDALIGILRSVEGYDVHLETRYAAACAAY